MPISDDEMKEAARAILEHLLDPNSKTPVPTWVTGVHVFYSHDVCEICATKLDMNLLRCGVCHKYTGPCCSAQDPALYAGDDPGWLCCVCEMELEKNDDASTGE